MQQRGRAGSRGAKRLASALAEPAGQRSFGGSSPGAVGGTTPSVRPIRVAGGLSPIRGRRLDHARRPCQRSFAAGQLHVSVSWPVASRNAVRVWCRNRQPAFSATLSPGAPRSRPSWRNQMTSASDRVLFDGVAVLLPLPRFPRFAKGRRLLSRSDDGCEQTGPFLMKHCSHP